MATGPYNLPQGIDIDGQRHQAVPRKVGAYDMEGINTAAVIPSQLVYFQNSTQFGQVLAVLTQKIYGRDTNITSRNGGMAKGERLYAYGLTAKIDAGNQVINSAAGAVIFDQWRRLWGIADVAINLGADEFIRCQGRDVPVHAPRTPFVDSAAVFILTLDISGEGMFDLTIAGDPYVLDQQEDFRINLNFTPQTLTLALETHITMRLEGIRLKSLRQ
jgi:hypothetical protein